MKSLLSKKLAKIDVMVFRVVLIYLVFGMGWIFFSDSILAIIIPDPKKFTEYSIFKGWAFIGFTAILLFFLMRKTFNQHAVFQSSLQTSEERWKFALEGSGDGVWDWDLETNQVFRSARWREIYGYDENDLEPTPQAGRQLMHPDDLEQAVKEIEDYLQGRTEVYHSEFRLKCKDGSWKWTLSRGKVFRDPLTGKAVRKIGIHTDISSRKQTEAEIVRLAHYDPVTGLPNRVLFIDRLNQAIKKSNRAHQTVTVLFLDLDKFKEVNDTLGHDKGDLLLKEAAQRLLGSVREMDTVARLGGDEFTVILNDSESEKVTERIAQNILETLAEPFEIDGESVYITASIGISIYPDDGIAIEALLKSADQAMYAAKEIGGNCYHYFTQGMQADALKRKQLITDLRQATKDNQFEVFYQPIVALASNRIYKAEALIRWHHPERGVVSPLEFISVAEDTGLINEIGDWVFKQTANQVLSWRAFEPDFQISVNKSPVQFRSANQSCVTWAAYLGSLGLNGSSIIVEITEGLLLDARDVVVEQLEVFRNAGIEIAIDDFGTGYSSLAYLRKFSIDYVKIDRSFTSNIKPGSSDMALCEAIIVMAHKLGMKVIAEGIETIAQRDLLLEAGCDYGQGYWFSKPLPARQFEAMFFSG
ncbi:putative bifunctional diguanylate cyclase/phosphodiesterase [Methyloradius palustris]|nr:GGDEF domain-containing phosphodiesterase [Methyloradius palustris]